MILWCWVATAWGTVLRGGSVRKVENRCLKLTFVRSLCPFWISRSAWPSCLCLWVSPEVEQPLVQRAASLAQFWGPKFLILAEPCICRGLPGGHIRTGNHRVREEAKETEEALVSFCHNNLCHGNWLSSPMRTIQFLSRTVSWIPCTGIYLLRTLLPLNNCNENQTPITWALAGHKQTMLKPRQPPGKKFSVSGWNHKATPDFFACWFFSRFLEWTGEFYWSTVKQMNEFRMYTLHFNEWQPFRNAHKRQVSLFCEHLYLSDIQSKQYIILEPQ